MFWLGLVPSIAYIPGYTGATIPTGWVALSICFACISWKGAKLTPFHWCLLAFLAYATLTGLWAPGTWNWAWRMWHYALIGLAFWIGSIIDIRPVLIGLSAALTISTAVSIAQTLGYSPVLVHSAGESAGLFFNPIYQGAAIALALTALWGQRLYWYALPLLPGLYLSHSRAAWAAALLGLLANYIRMPLLLITIILLLAAGVTLNVSTSDTYRLQNWTIAIHWMSFFGNGAGSWLDLWYLNYDGLVRPEFVHNDYLQLAFELGIGCIPLAIIGGYCLTQTSASNWPVMVAFAFLASVFMPLHSPIPAFIGALCAGHIVGNWHLSLHWRSTLLSRLPTWRSVNDEPSR